MPDPKKVPAMGDAASLSSRNPLPLTELAIQSYTLDLARKCEPSDAAIEEIKTYPIPLIIPILDEMCKYPTLCTTQQQLLSNPECFGRILRFNESYTTKLIKLIQCLELNLVPILKPLVQRMCEAIQQPPRYDDSHVLGYEGTLRFGRFLSESGWHDEACEILQLMLKKIDKNDKLKMLQVLRPLLISETIAYKYDTVNTTNDSILKLYPQIKPPTGLLVGLLLAVSIYYFEISQMPRSYEYGHRAFVALDTTTCPERQFIDVYRHFSKLCFALKQVARSKLLITQAVNRAWHSYGSTSRVYAATLEDYAIYLLMMNAPTDSNRLYYELEGINGELYGYYNEFTQVTQTSKRYKQYLQTFIYRDLEAARKHTEHGIASSQDIYAGDPRTMAAVRGVRPLLTAERARYGHERPTARQDSYQEVALPKTAAEVRCEFDAMEN